MAWIPLRRELLELPEIIEIQAQAGLTLAEVVFGLWEFWSWADANTDNGIIEWMTIENLHFACPHLVRHLSARCPQLIAQIAVQNLFDAMVRVKWLIIGKDHITIANFDRYMSNAGRRRASDNKRKSESRKNQRKSKEDKELATPNPRKKPVRKVSASCPQDVRTDADKLPTECGQDEDLHIHRQLGELDSPNTPFTSSSNKFEEEVTSTHASGFARDKASSKAAKSEVIMTFPCDGKVKSWDLTQGHVDKWQQLYPSLDILTECRKAWAYADSSSVDRKTARGMSRFLVNWFNRAMERGGSRRASPGQPAKSRQTTIEEKIAEHMQTQGTEDEF